MKAFHKHLLTGLVAFGLVASAFAADTAVCDPMGQGHAYGMRDGASSAKYAERMKARMDKRHAALHDKLKLNAEQEVAWKEYIAGATPPAAGMRMNHAEITKLSAPERMEKMISFMKDREAQMTVRMVSLKKFYAVLTAEQQKTFDAESIPQHGRRHKHGKK